MNIYIDENIPYAKMFFSEFGTLHFFSGRDVTPETLQYADVLLVRSVTQVNKEILKLNKCLKFVGTATIGTDHIDQAYLKSRNIAFSSAPGCNKISVAEYVLSTLFVVAEKEHFELKTKSVAIVGAGNTGTAVYDRLTAMGMDCVLFDPPLEHAGDPREFCDFSTVLKADIISLHVPKIKAGEHPTFHLFNEEILGKLTTDQILINASRGEIVDNQALLSLCKENKAPILVLDVWENEPNIEQQLLPFVRIATPHIAGYSLDGKVRGTEMLYQSLCQVLSIKQTHLLEQFIPKANISHVSINTSLDFTLLKSLMHLVYDVRRDDVLFRQKVADKHGFDTMRKNYSERRELSSLTITSKINQQTLLSKLGFSIENK